MLDILRGDDVDIQLYLADNPSSDPNESVFSLKGRGQRLVYSAAANEFVDICAVVENHSGACCSVVHFFVSSDTLAFADQPLALSLRLELRPPESSSALSSAALSHLARYIVIEGVSPVLLPELGARESTTVRVSVCLLAEGRYELGCVVEPRRGAEGAAAETGERRRYKAREPIVFHVDR